MDVSLSRLWLTVVVGLISVFVLFVTRGPNSEIASWKKKGDAGRISLIFNEDGSLKRNAKPYLIGGLIFVILLVWAVPDRFIATP